jgi:hypothetical protein
VQAALFHFKKDHVACSIAADDYNKDLPLFVAIKENRWLNEFFLYVVTCWRIFTPARASAP